jgi:uncharacterized protein (TIGR04141 family)
MAGAKSQVHTLSIFLMKEGYASNARCLKPDGAVERMRIAQGGHPIGELVWRQNSPKPPKWLALFHEAPDLKLPDLFNASNSAVLFVKRKDRMFALAFGFGRHLLAPGAYEEQFGLRVTLNSVDPVMLRSLDHKNFEAIASHSRTQTSQAADVAAFGLNVEQDLLCAATGEPIEKSLGKRMSGMDSLSVAVPVRLRGLGELLDSYRVKFEEPYKEVFRWVEHIGEVRDRVLCGELDAELLEVLRHEKLAEMRAWLSVPDLIQWAQVEGFRYSARRGALHEDLHLRDFFATLHDRTALSLETLKHRSVFAIGVEGDQVVHRWSVHECLYCELDRKDTTYLLTRSKWYRVDRDFVSSVNKAVKKLVRVTPLPLPAYNDASEGDYNKRAVKEARGALALVDRKLVPIGGSRIEPCDLLSKSHEMIHVKCYGGSSVLSHLFAQGAVAGRTFSQDAAFRSAFNKLIPRTMRLTNPTVRINATAYEIVYAVVSRSAKPIDQALPFFSRLNLRAAAAQLQGFGYRVSLVKIPVETT